jgi:sugar phosphate isomerase/epimerase
MTARIVFSVFTKPWPKLSVPQLGELVSGLGFDGIELPVRPGFPVEPTNVAHLPRVVRQLRDLGVRVFSVAGPTDEATMEACAEAGVPIIRVMARIVADESYLEAEDRLRREYDGLLPKLEKHGVKLGVQNHCGRFIANAVGLRSVLQNYDPRYIGVVWDAAHEALQGSAPDLALDAIWPHLCMVNLKNAYWQRTNGSDAQHAKWRIYWTAGRDGLASWPNVVQELKARGYKGVVCLTAEYSHSEAVERLVAADLAFAQALLHRK